PDRRAAVRDLPAIAPELTEDELLELPLITVGTVRQIADQLRALRERLGFSYFSVLDPFMETLAPVIEELRGS
ncbi:LLM class F420-dependent oxidoreductase, partial [Streptomyces sp. NPDC056730]